MTQQQQNPVEPCKIFVGGLDHNTDDDSVKKYFEKYGEVKEVTIMRDSHTGHSRGFGFVTFIQQEPVNQVVEDGPSKGHYLNGKKIDPKRATVKNSKQSSNKVFVGGLPQCEDNELIEFFGTMGFPVVSVDIKIDQDSGQCRGFGFVELASKEDVERLTTKWQYVNFKNKRIEIKIARPRGDNPKQQQQQQVHQHQSLYPQSSGVYEQKVYPSSQFHPFPQDYPPVYPAQQTQHQQPTSYYAGQYQQSYHHHYYGSSGYDPQPQQQHDHTYVQQQQHHSGQQMPAAPAAPAPPSQGQQQMSYQSAPTYAVSNGRAAAAPPNAYTGNLSTSYSSFNYQQQDASGRGTQDPAAASMTAYPNYDQQAMAANSYSHMGVHPPRQPTL